MLNHKQRSSPPSINARTQSATRATLLPIAIGEVLASVETLSLGRLFQRRGLLRGVSARSATPGTVRHAALSMLDAPITPKVLATVNLVAATALIVGGKRRSIQVGSSIVIATCNRLAEIRTPYGRDGADQMTAVITQYRALSALIPEASRSDDLFLRAVNFQAGLSYFVSGVSKLLGSSWVQGDALGEVAQTDAYGGGPAAKLLRRHPHVTRVLTWITPLWETCFPLVYLAPPRYGRWALAAVKGFHVAVTAAMELPRFVWGFTGSHGAIGYVLDRQRTVTGRLEQNVLMAAAAVTGVSATYAAGLRALDNERRGGLKGTELLSRPDGHIEFQHVLPIDPSAVQDRAPVVVLEAGLGNPLDAWSLVRDRLPNCHVMSYHRTGYGRTTSKTKARDAVDALIRQAGSDGPVIVAAHSIGTLAAAEYASATVADRSISALVVVDGTDPDVFDTERSNRRRVGSFLQSQAHSMFAALTGVYNFAPHAVARQSRYEPDEQQGTIQFVFAPRNIYRATREYFSMSTVDTIESLRAVPHRFVIGSAENAEQQRALAEKLQANYTTAPESSHRSILGFRSHATLVASLIQEAIDAAS